MKPNSDIVMVCDDCRAQFRPHIHVRRLPDGGEQHYMRCDQCGREYTAAAITARGVKLRQRMAVIRSRTGVTPQWKRLQAALAQEISQ